MMQALVLSGALVGTLALLAKSVKDLSVTSRKRSKVE